MNNNSTPIQTAGQQAAGFQAQQRPLNLARLAGLMLEGEQTRPELPWLDDLEGEEAPTPFLFYLNGEGGPFGIIAAANLHTIKGLEKTGKSAAGMALIVAAMHGYFLGIEPARAGLRVLWIDTEQDRQTLRQKARAALAMAQRDTRPEELRILPLRAYAVADRLKLTRQAIEETAPDLVLLDGVVDLCEEFNEEKPSRAVVNELAAICEKTGAAILGLIHANRKDDQKARGHLGTLMQQKSAEIYHADKSGDTATIRQERSRFAPVPAFRFEFADGFRIKAADGAEALAAKVTDLREIFGRLFDGKDTQRHTDLVTGYKIEADCKDSTAKKAIRDGLIFHILKKTGTGTDTRYSLLTPEELFEDLQEEGARAGSRG